MAEFRGRCRNAKLEVWLLSYWPPLGSDLGDQNTKDHSILSPDQSKSAAAGNTDVSTNQQWLCSNEWGRVEQNNNNKTTTTTNKQNKNKLTTKHTHTHTRARARTHARKHARTHARTHTHTYIASEVILWHWHKNRQTKNYTRNTYIHTCMHACIDRIHTCIRPRAYSVHKTILHKHKQQ